MDEAYELKKELKKWEAQFVQEQNRKPQKVGPKVCKLNFYML